MSTVGFTIAVKYVTNGPQIFVYCVALIHEAYAVYQFKVNIRMSVIIKKSSILNAVPKKKVFLFCLRELDYYYVSVRAPRKKNRVL